MFIEIVSVKFCTPSACTERGRSLIYPEVEGAPIVGIGIGTELPHAQIEPAQLFLGIVGGIARIVIGEHIDIADTGLVLSPWIEGTAIRCSCRIHRLTGQYHRRPSHRAWQVPSSRRIADRWHGRCCRSRRAYRGRRRSRRPSHARCRCRWCCRYNITFLAMTAVPVNDSPPESCV